MGTLMWHSQICFVDSTFCETHGGGVRVGVGGGALESGYPPEIDDIYEQPLSIDGARTYTKVIPTGAGQSERPGGGWRLFDSL